VAAGSIKHNANNVCMIIIDVLGNPFALVPRMGATLLPLIGSTFELRELKKEK
jgi:hypothetical protein